MGVGVKISDPKMFCPRGRLEVFHEFVLFSILFVSFCKMCRRRLGKKKKDSRNFGKFPKQVLSFGEKREILSEFF